MLYAFLFTKIEEEDIGNIWFQKDGDLWAAVKDNCYADKPETIDALMDNIREAIGEIQLHTTDNVLKN